MTTLAKDTPRVVVDSPEIIGDLPVIAADIVYDGAAVGRQTVTGANKGYARPFSSTDSDEFAGIALENCDNSAGAVGAKKVRTLQQGIVKLSVVGTSAITHVNDDVYCDDDDTFTLSSTGNVKIGKITRWITGTTCEVFVQALSLQSI